MIRTAKDGPRKLDRESWTSAGLALLAKAGIASVNVEPLAARLGVSKGSFYWHFRDRRELHAAMLDHWRRAGTAGIVEAVREGSEPHARLSRLLRVITEAPSANLETAVRAWANFDPATAAIVTAVDRERISFMAGLLHEAGVPTPRAQELSAVVYLTMIGGFVCSSYGHDVATPQTWREIESILSSAELAGTSGNPSG